MEIEQDDNIVSNSQNLHKNTSYYNSTIHLSDETKRHLNDHSIITQGGQPQLIAVRIKEPELVNNSIAKYKFMNDGVWMKILIDRNDYPELKETSISQMKAEFTNDGLEFEIKVNQLLFYNLKIQKTREKIIPEKSKIYERKNYIYIAIHKEKEGDWWSLKY